MILIDTSVMKPCEMKRGFCCKTEASLSLKDYSLKIREDY